MNHDNAVEIRRAAVADIPAIARVHVDVWRSAYRGIVPDAYLDGLAYEGRERMWRSVLGEYADRHVAYVADHGAEGVIGFALGGDTEEPGFDAELMAIYVLDRFQQRGIGRRLVAAVAADLAARGERSLVLWVLADNPSRRFYEAIGGRLVRSKMEEIGSARLEEVAYAWEALSTLAGPTAH